ncbi:MAG: hypothetical protein IPG50_13795 [Myxococcales bacterium]|nr:hypothetical protein [Myxococcales bacterium]
MGEELGVVPEVVPDEQVLVVAHRDEAMQRDLVALARLREAVEVNLLDAHIRTQQVLPLRAAPTGEVRATGHDLTGKRHERHIGSGANQVASTGEKGTQDGSCWSHRVYTVNCRPRRAHRHAAGAGAACSADW